MKYLNAGFARRKEVCEMLKIPFTILFLAASAVGVGQNPAAITRAVSVLMRDSAVRNAHVGISIYDPGSRRTVYSYQDDKYFVPASNTKIVTAYAALKNLKHFLTGIRYYENDTAIYLLPTGDPTLLHRDFTHQPVIDFLKQTEKKVYITDENYHDKELGQGWSWDDYSDEYMTERNALPVYGNVLKWVQEKIRSNAFSSEESFSMYSDPEVDWKVQFEPNPEEPKFKVQRERLSNTFTITEGTENKKEVFVPFITNGISTALELLADTIHKEIPIIEKFVVTDPQRKSIVSQPLDSVLRPMMYRSDNFFAEQLLLMVSDERFGVMDAEMIVDTLLNDDLSWLPHKPVWVDGSGLSRYNLFTPRDFTVLLDSMHSQFGMDRLKTIFPTSDSGTLKNYYNRAPAGRDFIYAKTGSMSGVVALSGYLYTLDRRLLIFSILINNFDGKATPVRRAVERFILRVRSGK